MDTAKAVSVATGLPMVSIPTTYAGAEWTPFFGVRNPETRTKDAGFDARVEGIVYEPELTLEMPAQVTAGTALNALTHCAEALYVPGRTEESDDHALQGAALISRHLPAVLEDGRELEERRGLLEGSMHGGAALRVGMGLAHAMAQSLGGRYGVPHGAMNAICLPPALRFNAEVAAFQIARLGEAMGTADPAKRTEELAALALDTRLRDYDIPRDDLGELSAATAERGAAKTNPRPASVDEIRELFESVW
jgi:maleylacetate reductase